MKETTRGYVRRIVQGVSALAGVLGVVWIYLGVRVTVGTVADREWASLIIVAMFLAFGGIMVAVAYQVVFRYSPSAIASVSTLFGFAVYGLLSRWTRVMWDTAWNGKNMAAQFVWLASPIVAAWICYRMTKWLLLRWTIKAAE
ncbi:MAG: hypothetical protein PHR35_07665 [Kiritimatiellae bacterium]|nr:hypothetical protein [Kiritimatiellia bacterium]